MGYGKGQQQEQQQEQQQVQQQEKQQQQQAEVEEEVEEGQGRQRLRGEQVRGSGWRCRCPKGSYLAHLLAACLNFPPKVTIQSPTNKRKHNDGSSSNIREGCVNLFLHRACRIHTRANHPPTADCDGAATETSLLARQLCAPVNCVVAAAAAVAAPAADTVAVTAVSVGRLAAAPAMTIANLHSLTSAAAAAAARVPRGGAMQERSPSVAEADGDGPCDVLLVQIPQIRPGGEGEGSGSPHGDTTITMTTGPVLRNCTSTVFDASATASYQRQVTLLPRSPTLDLQLQPSSFVVSRSLNDSLSVYGMLEYDSGPASILTAGQVARPSPAMEWAAAGGGGSGIAVSAVVPSARPSVPAGSLLSSANSYTSTTYTSGSRPSRWGIRQLAGLLSAGLVSLRRRLARVAEPRSGNLRPEAVAELARWTGRTDLLRAVAQVTDLEIISQNASRSIVCRGTAAGGTRVYVKYTAAPGGGDGMAAAATEGLLSRILVHPNVVRTYGWSLTQVTVTDVSGDLETALAASARRWGRRRRRHERQDGGPPPHQTLRQPAQRCLRLSLPPATAPPHRHPRPPQQHRIDAVPVDGAYSRHGVTSTLATRPLLLRPLDRWKQISSSDSSHYNSGGGASGGGSSREPGRGAQQAVAPPPAYGGISTISSNERRGTRKPTGAAAGSGAVTDVKGNSRNTDTGGAYPYPESRSAPASMLIAVAMAAASGYGEAGVTSHMPCSTGVAAASGGSGGGNGCDGCGQTSPCIVSAAAAADDGGGSSSSPSNSRNGGCGGGGSLGGESSPYAPAAAKPNEPSPRPLLDLSNTRTGVSTIFIGLAATARSRSLGTGVATAAMAAAPPPHPAPPSSPHLATLSPIPQLSWAQAARAWQEVQDMLRRLNAQPGDYLARIVMEAADLGSLLNAIRQGLFSGCPVPSQRLRALLLTARDVARGTMHLHRHSVLHGDLKPSNVLLRSDPTDPRGFVALVSDFGLSRVAPEGLLEGTEPFGTVSFMAPEVFTGRRYPASDVYSYGVLLWQTVTGQPPWPGLRNVQVMMGVMQGDLRLSAPPGTYPPLSDLIERCLAPCHTERPCFEVIERELEAMLAAVEQSLVKLAAEPAAAAATTAAASAEIAATTATCSATKTTAAAGIAVATAPVSCCPNSMCTPLSLPPPSPAPPPSSSDAPAAVSLMPSLVERPAALPPRAATWLSKKPDQHAQHNGVAITTTATTIASSCTSRVFRAPASPPVRLGCGTTPHQFVQLLAVDDEPAAELMTAATAAAAAADIDDVMESMLLDSSSALLGLKLGDRSLQSLVIADADDADADEIPAVTAAAAAVAKGGGEKKEKLRHRRHDVAAGSGSGGGAPPCPSPDGDPNDDDGHHYALQLAQQHQPTEVARTVIITPTSTKEVTVVQRTGSVVAGISRSSNGADGSSSKSSKSSSRAAHPPQPLVVVTASLLLQPPCQQQEQQQQASSALAPPSAADATTAIAAAQLVLPFTITSMDLHKKGSRSSRRRGGSNSSSTSDSQNGSIQSSANIAKATTASNPAAAEDNPADAVSTAAATAVTATSAATAPIADVGLEETDDNRRVHWGRLNRWARQDTAAFSPAADAPAASCRADAEMHGGGLARYANSVNADEGEDEEEEEEAGNGDPLQQQQQGQGAAAIAAYSAAAAILSFGSSSIGPKLPMLLSPAMVPTSCSSSAAAGDAGSSSQLPSSSTTIQRRCSWCISASTLTSITFGRITQTTNMNTTTAMISSTATSTALMLRSTSTLAQPPSPIVTKGGGGGGGGGMNSVLGTATAIELAMAAGQTTAADDEHAAAAGAPQAGFLGVSDAAAARLRS